MTAATDHFVDKDLARFLEGLRGALGGAAAALTRPRAERLEVVIHEADADEGDLHRLEMPAQGARHCGVVIATGRPLAVERGVAEQSSPVGYLRAEGIESYLGAPVLSAEGRVIGALSVLSRDPRAWNAAETEEVATAARFLGLMLRPASG